MGLTFFSWILHKSPLSASDVPPLWRNEWTQMSKRRNAGKSRVMVSFTQQADVHYGHVDQSGDGGLSFDLV
jgi:hypothetical protein